MRMVQSAAGLTRVVSGCVHIRMPRCSTSSSITLGRAQHLTVTPDARFPTASDDPPTGSLGTYPEDSHGAGDAARAVGGRQETA